MDVLAFRLSGELRNAFGNSVIFQHAGEKSPTRKNNMRIPQNQLLNLSRPFVKTPIFIGFFAQKGGDGNSIIVSINNILTPT